MKLCYRYNSDCPLGRLAFILYVELLHLFQDVPTSSCCSWKLTSLAELASPVEVHFVVGWP